MTDLDTSGNLHINFKKYFLKELSSKCFTNILFNLFCLILFPSLSHPSPSVFLSKLKILNKFIFSLIFKCRYGFSNFFGKIFLIVRPKNIFTQHCKLFSKIN